MTGPRYLTKIKLAEQEYYLAYVETCRNLGFPVLWPNPLQVRNDAELKRRNNGGRNPRRTRAQILRDKENLSGDKKN